MKIPSVFCPKAAKIARLMSEYKFSWPARYVRVHLRRNHMISELTSGLSKLLKPASTALLSISDSLKTAAANLTTGSVDS